MCRKFSHTRLKMLLWYLVVTDTTDHKSVKLQIHTLFCKVWVSCCVACAPCLCSTTARKVCQVWALSHQVWSWSSDTKSSCRVVLCTRHLTEEKQNSCLSSTCALCPLVTHSYQRTLFSLPTESSWRWLCNCRKVISKGGLWVWYHREVHKWKKTKNCCYKKLIPSAQINTWSIAVTV